MGLTLRFGTYTHLLGEVQLRIGRQTQWTDQGVPFQETVTWDIQGRVEGDDTADVVAELARLNVAYAAKNQFVRATLTDGNGTVCALLDGRKSIDGIRVDQPPSHPDGSGAELTTYRNYAVRLSARFHVGNPLSLIVSFNETLTFSGGGPDRDLIVCATGPPIEYVTAAQTPFECHQSGSAVGYLAYPVALARPAFPLALHRGPLLPVVYGSPKGEANADTHWPIQWQYRFASAAPLKAVPRRFPR